MEIIAPAHCIAPCLEPDLLWFGLTATQAGHLAVGQVNFRSGGLIFREFTLPHVAKPGRITCISPHPVYGSLVALGTSTGYVVLLDWGPQHRPTPIKVIASFLSSPVTSVAQQFAVSTLAWSLKHGLLLAASLGGTMAMHDMQLHATNVLNLGHAPINLAVQPVKEELVVVPCTDGLFILPLQFSYIVHQADFRPMGLAGYAFHFLDASLGISLQQRLGIHELRDASIPQQAFFQTQALEVVPYAVFDASVSQDRQWFVLSSVTEGARPTSTIESFHPGTGQRNNLCTLYGVVPSSQMAVAHDHAHILVTDNPDSPRLDSYPLQAKPPVSSGYSAGI